MRIAQENEIQLRLGAKYYLLISRRGILSLTDEPIRFTESIRGSTAKNLVTSDIICPVYISRKAHIVTHSKDYDVNI